MDLIFRGGGCLKIKVAQNILKQILERKILNSVIFFYKMVNFGGLLGHLAHHESMKHFVGYDVYNPNLAKLTDCRGLKTS